MSNISDIETQVIKLGGTSQTKEGYSTLINNIDSKVKTVIVVSAIKNVTNLLIEQVNNGFCLDNFDTIKELNQKLVSDLGIDLSFFDKDFEFLDLKMKTSMTLQDNIDIVSYGETLTAKILNQYLNRNNVVSNYLDSVDIISCNLKNDTLFNKGEFSVNNENIFELFKYYDVLVVPGFRGKNIDNQISLMGRGGSDTTGSIIASSLKSNKYQIWTDVNGIYTSDPNKIKNTNIIPSISYDAAQEISAMGAKVIHPYCIKPCKIKNIPIEIRNTYNYNSEFTTVESNISSSEKVIYAITNQNNITIFKIESLNMWNNYGFVYDIFSKFKDFNVDVNIINTSQFDITTTTDDIDINKLQKLKTKLEEYYNVNMFSNCNCVSVVGQNLKKYDKLNQIMNRIIGYDIKLTSYSSNDMTISFVVENSISNKLVSDLHNVIFPFNEFKNDNKLWWNELLYFNGPDSCKYMYDIDIIKEKISVLKRIKNVDRIYYALKANNNVEVLKTILENKMGIETVSLEEVNLILKIARKEHIDKINMLYTPNFANIDDYKTILNGSEYKRHNIIIILDNIDLLKAYPEVFKDKSIGIRLDLDYGFGHCSKVITQGQESKFGMTTDDLLNNLDLFEINNITIIGLHSHMGSGITNYMHWINNSKLINEVYKRIPNNINKIEWFDIGGGFGIDNTIDFDSLDMELYNIKKEVGNNVKIFIEPGRFIVAESGVIWGKVTQIKTKNNTKFIGTNIGMTDLIRPALYSAIHPVYFKDENSEKELVTVVGPICESGDILIKNLLVNKNIKINDSVIVTNTGAYGFVMASNYNNRKLPDQLIMENN